MQNTWSHLFPGTLWKKQTLLFTKLIFYLFLRASQPVTAAAATGAPLPIDPESLDPTKVIVIKPSAAVEVESTTQPKKLRKKKKKVKTTATLDLDPLSVDQGVQ